jgi:hypothetical protein
MTISDLKENYTGKKVFKKDNPEKLFFRQRSQVPRKRLFFGPNIFGAVYLNYSYRSKFSITFWIFTPSLDLFSGNMFSFFEGTFCTF